MNLDVLVSGKAVFVTTVSNKNNCRPSPGPIHYRKSFFSLKSNKRMPPPGKKRRVEDRDYAEPSGSAAAYNSSAATTSRARALAENKAAQLAVQQEKQARALEQRDDQSPLVRFPS